MKEEMTAEHRKVLIDQETLMTRISEMGEEITRDYQERSGCHRDIEGAVMFWLIW